SISASLVVAVALGHSFLLAPGSRRRVLAQNEWPERSNVALAEQHYAGSADSWPIRAILMNTAG
ncbi:MAG: hypothetical protein ACT4PV_02555, partial [Planctomycetaceae bacterium]